MINNNYDNVNPNPGPETNCQPEKELDLYLQDGEWPFEYNDHDRQIVRAIVYDGEPTIIKSIGK